MTRLEAGARVRCLLKRIGPLHLGPFPLTSGVWTYKHIQAYPHTPVGAGGRGKYAHLLESILNLTCFFGHLDSTGNARTLPDQVGGGEELWEPEGASCCSSYFPKGFYFPDSNSRLQGSKSFLHIPGLLTRPRDFRGLEGESCL